MPRGSREHQTSSRGGAQTPADAPSQEEVQAVLGLGSEDPDDDPFSPGSGNLFIDQQIENQADFSWIDFLEDSLVKQFSGYYTAIGLDPLQARAAVLSNFNALGHYLDDEIMGVSFDEAGQASADPRMQAFYTTTSTGLNALFNISRNWLISHDANLGRVARLAGGTQPTRSGRGGGGRGPTAAEIRQQFDLDQLSNSANDLWRAHLLEESDDPRGIAKAYVDAVVATGGQQKIDFATFVRSRIEKTSRYASIYRSKPESVGALDHLTPYHQTARQVMGSTDEAAEAAIGGAQFGASGASFAARLSRTDAATSSAPYIQSLEQRMNALSGVLKG